MQLPLTETEKITIDGVVTNAEMGAQYDTLWLLCDGTEWHIIGR